MFGWQSVRNWFKSVNLPKTNMKFCHVWYEENWTQQFFFLVWVFDSSSRLWIVTAFGIQNHYTNKIKQKCHPIIWYNTWKENRIGTIWHIHLLCKISSVSEKAIAHIYIVVQATKTISFQIHSFYSSFVNEYLVIDIDINNIENTTSHRVTSTISNCEIEANKMPSFSLFIW